MAQTHPQTSKKSKKRTKSAKKSTISQKKKKSAKKTTKKTTKPRSRAKAALKSGVNPRIVNRSTLVKIFGIVGPVLSQWESHGCPSLGKSGRESFFDTVEVFKWRLKREADLLELKAPSIGKQRKIDADAELSELRAGEKSGKLVDKDDVYTEVFTMMRQVRDGFKNIASKLAAQLSIENDERTIHDIIDREISGVMQDMTQQGEDL